MLASKRSLKVLIPIVVLAASASLAWALVATSPQAARKHRPKRAAIVEVKPVELGSHKTLVSAMGTVEPAVKIKLQPRVSGEVVYVSPEFVPGGRFRKGEEILRIDTSDYELLVTQQQSVVRQAKANLQLEKGSQAIAVGEYELLDEKISPQDRDLVLRKPQLETSRAALALAEARLKKAMLDLERTSIKAPFNALVLNRSVELGAQVAPTSTLAELVGADEYWVEASVPVNQLQWLTIPAQTGNAGSKAKIEIRASWGESSYRQGVIKKLAGDLDSQGRMARLIVSVRDPLGGAGDRSGETGLILNSYVSLELEGATLSSVASLSRQHLREDDTVWLMNEAEELEIRPVMLVYRGKKRVLVSDGLAHGDRLIVSNLPAPVQGMPLRLRKPGSLKDAQQ